MVQYNHGLLQICPSHKDNMFHLVSILMLKLDLWENRCDTYKIEAESSPQTVLFLACILHQGLYVRLAYTEYVHVLCNSSFTTRASLGLILWYIFAEVNKLNCTTLIQTQTLSQVDRALESGLVKLTWMSLSIDNYVSSVYEAPRWTGAAHGLLQRSGGVPCRCRAAQYGHHHAVSAAGYWTMDRGWVPGENTGMSVNYFCARLHFLRESFTAEELHMLPL